MAGAFVQQVGSHTQTSTSYVITVGTAATGFSGTTTIGNRVVAALCIGSGDTCTGVVDSKSNTWAIDKQGAAASGATSCIASAALTTALVTGDTITFTISASVAVHGGAIEISGVSGPDQSATHHVTGTSNTVATTVNSGDNDLVVVAHTSSGAASTITIGSSDADSGGTWTDMAYPYAVSTTGGVDIGYQSGLATASLYTSTGTASTAVNMDSTIVSYAASGGSPTNANAGLAAATGKSLGEDDSTETAQVAVNMTIQGI